MAEATPANRPNPNGPRMEVEVVDGNKTDRGNSVHVGEQSPDSKVTHEQEGHVDLGAGKPADQRNGAAEGDLPKGDDTEAVKADDADKTEGEDKPKEEAAKELPKFDPADEASVKAYDEHFKVGEGGTFDMGRFSTEWWQNAQTNGDAGGSLNDGTYEYLATKGYDKDFVKQVERGQFALVEQQWGGYFQRAGGKDAFDKAFAWATNKANSGYDAAQKASFNKALDAGGEQANDAIDLMMSRFNKADTRRVNPNGGVEGGAGGNAGAEGRKGDTYSTRDEWITARKEAGRDMAKQQAVSDKMRRSPNAKKW